MGISPNIIVLRADEKIEKDTDRDFYMTAIEAKEYGIIDEILFNTKK